MLKGRAAACLLAHDLEAGDVANSLLLRWVLLVDQALAVLENELVVHLNQLQTLLADEAQRGLTGVRDDLVV